MASRLVVNEDGTVSCPMLVAGANIRVCTHCEECFGITSLQQLVLCKQGSIGQNEPRYILARKQLSLQYYKKEFRELSKAQKSNIKDIYFRKFGLEEEE